MDHFQLFEFRVYSSQKKVFEVSCLSILHFNLYILHAGVESIESESKTPTYFQASTMKYEYAQ